MAILRNNSDIVKGSMLMVFLNNAPIGFATSHAFTITTNTTEVSTKDHGDYPSVIAQSISWEVTAENLYSDAGESTYLTAQLNKTPVTLKFAKASNYNATDEKGVVGVDNADEWSASTAILSGKALITSFSVNAPAGDNATMSVTFTGVGSLDQEGSSGAQGATGATG